MVTKEIKKKIWKETNGCCIYCGKQTIPYLPNYNKDKTTYDHIITVTNLNPTIHKFDPNGIVNITLACWDCNCNKRNNKPILEWCKEIGFVPGIIQNKLIQQKEQIKLEV